MRASLVKQRRALTKLWLRWRWPIVGATTLCVVIVASNIGLRHMSEARSTQRQEAMTSAAQTIARDVGKAFGAEAMAIAEILEQADLASTIAGGDEAAIGAMEEQLAAGHPLLVRVRLLGLGVKDTDYATNPPLSYASLDLLRRSERSDTRLSPEMHLFGEETAHVALDWQVRDADGRLIGHALLAIDPDIVVALMKGLKLPDGYAEVQQPASKGPPLALAKTGRASDRQGTPALRITVPGTRWKVAYWPERAAPVGEALPVPLWAAGVAILALAAGAAVVVVRRRQPDDEALVVAQAQAEVRGGQEEGALTKKLEALKTSRAPDLPADEDLGIEINDGSPAPAAVPAEEPPVPATTVELPATIFRAYDVRGVVGKTLTPEIVQLIGQAIGSEAYDRGQQTLVVGCDGRDSGPELVGALIDGLRSTGRDVIDVGRVPTPLLYFATHYLNTGSGVMVTGSHNPPQYNGLKIMLGGNTLFGDDIQGLRERAVGGELATGDGALQSMEVVDEYIRRVTEDIPVALGAAYKVVVDCGNGVAGDVAPKLIRALGHDVVELYCEVDGSFPNHHPDPSDPRNLEDLISAVVEHGADVGFAFDGDGDRLGVVDPEGNIIWPDRQLMLFAHDVLKRNQGAEIVFDVKCSNLLAKVIAKSGGKPVMCKTGHSFIKNELKQRAAPLAGEMSGHIFFKERWYGFDDALYAAARMLEILMNMKRKPVEVFARLPSGVGTPELRVDLEEGQQVEFMERIMQESPFSDGKVTTIDGLRVDYPDRWGLVRASNTTPSLVLRFEGKSAESLARIQEQFREVLIGIEPGLQLPF